MGAGEAIVMGSVMTCTVIKQYYVDIVKENEKNRSRNVHR